MENDLVLSMNVLIATIKNYRDLLRKRLEAATTPCAIPSTSGLQKQPPGMTELTCCNVFNYYENDDLLFQHQKLLRKKCANDRKYARNTHT